MAIWHDMIYHTMYNITTKLTIGNGTILEIWCCCTCIITNLHHSYFINENNDMSMLATIWKWKGYRPTIFFWPILSARIPLKRPSPPPIYQSIDPSYHTVISQRSREIITHLQPWNDHQIRQHHHCHALLYDDLLMQLHPIWILIVSYDIRKLGWKIEKELPDIQHQHNGYNWICYSPILCEINMIARMRSIYDDGQLWMSVYLNDIFTIGSIHIGSNNSTNFILVKYWCGTITFPIITTQ